MVNLKNVGTTAVYVFTWETRNLRFFSHVSYLKILSGFISIFFVLRSLSICGRGIL
ncbi:hypothetical protein LEP1GSC072_3502 [Leptospira noguchii str. Bonito]|nr:hypothetical protein LEP1GSC072_3502 [Leptospira noguchii str. Bonito]